MISGAASVSCAKRPRARRPLVPSSPSATARTLASTTITFCPKVTRRRAKRHPAAVAVGDAVENLIQSRLPRLSNQSAQKVFLQGLMRACGSLAQDLVGFLRNIFDLYTRHGAILAPSRKIQPPRHVPKLADYGCLWPCLALIRGISGAPSP